MDWLLPGVCRGEGLSKRPHLGEDDTGGSGGKALLEPLTHYFLLLIYNCHFRSHFIVPFRILFKYMKGMYHPSF